MPPPWISTGAPSTVSAIAEQQKGKVRPDFAVNPAWREELYQRLVADTVTIDKAVWDAGAADIDRAIEDRVAKVAFGDTLVRRRSLKDDNQLRAAINLLIISSPKVRAIIRA